MYRRTGAYIGARHVAKCYLHYVTYAGNKIYSIAIYEYVGLLLFYSLRRQLHGSAKTRTTGH